jgi:hypothetical protein
MLLDEVTALDPKGGLGRGYLRAVLHAIRPLVLPRHFTNDPACRARS